VNIKKNITLEDIAKTLNVSKVTVSKALRNHPDISELKKVQVRETALKLGYIPNFMARNLSSKKSYTIGVIVPKVTGDFFPDVIDHIYQTAYEIGYDVILAVSQENSENEIKHIQTLLAMCVDGFLISITGETKNTKIFDLIRERNVPLVFFDRVKSDLSSSSYVVSDDYNGVYAAMNQIIDSGYKKIAFIGGSLTTNIGKDRVDGFKKAIKDFNLNIKNSWIVEGGFSERDGYNGFNKILRQNKKNLLPEVVFSITYPVGIGVMRAAKESNINIPNDLNIMCFGGSHYNHFIQPSLSYVRQPVEKIGRLATSMLIDHIKNPDLDIQQIKISTDVVMRDTCLPKGVIK